MNWKFNFFLGNYSPIFFQQTKGSTEHIHITGRVKTKPFSFDSDPLFFLHPEFDLFFFRKGFELWLEAFSVIRLLSFIWISPNTRYKYLYPFKISAKIFSFNKFLVRVRANFLTIKKKSFYYPLFFSVYFFVLMFICTCPHALSYFFLRALEIQFFNYSVVTCCLIYLNLQFFNFLLTHWLALDRLGTLVYSLLTNILFPFNFIILFVSKIVATVEFFFYWVYFRGWLVLKTKIPYKNLQEKVFFWWNALNTFVSRWYQQIFGFVIKAIKLYVWFASFLLPKKLKVSKINTKTYTGPFTWVLFDLIPDFFEFLLSLFFLTLKNSFILLFCHFIPYIVFLKFYYYSPLYWLRKAESTVFSQIWPLLDLFCQLYIGTKAEVKYFFILAYRRGFGDFFYNFFKSLRSAGQRNMMLLEWNTRSKYTFKYFFYLFLIYIVIFYICLLKSAGFRNVWDLAIWDWLMYMPHVLAFYYFWYFVKQQHGDETTMYYLRDALPGKYPWRKAMSWKAFACCAIMYFGAILEISHSQYSDGSYRYWIRASNEGRRAHVGTLLQSHYDLDYKECKLRDSGAFSEDEIQRLLKFHNVINAVYLSPLKCRSHFVGTRVYPERPGHIATAADTMYYSDYINNYEETHKLNKMLLGDYLTNLPASFPNLGDLQKVTWLDYHAYRWKQQYWELLTENHFRAVLKSQYDNDIKKFFAAQRVKMQRRLFWSSYLRFFFSAETPYIQTIATKKSVSSDMLSLAVRKHLYLSIPFFFLHSSSIFNNSIADLSFWTQAINFNLKVWFKEDLFTGINPASNLLLQKLEQYAYFSKQKAPESFLSFLQASRLGLFETAGDIFWFGCKLKNVKKSLPGLATVKQTMLTRGKRQTMLTLNLCFLDSPFNLGRRLNPWTSKFESFDFLKAPHWNITFDFFTLPEFDKWNKRLSATKKSFFYRYLTKYSSTAYPSEVRLSQEKTHAKMKVRSFRYVPPHLQETYPLKYSMDKWRYTLQLSRMQAFMRQSGPDIPLDEYLQITSRAFNPSLWRSQVTEDFNEVHSTNFGFNNWNLINNRAFLNFMLPLSQRGWFDTTVVSNNLLPEFDSAIGINSDYWNHISLTQKLEHTDRWQDDLWVFISRFVDNYTPLYFTFFKRKDWILNSEFLFGNSLKDIKEFSGFSSLFDLDKNKFLMSLDSFKYFSYKTVFGELFTGSTWKQSHFEDLIYQYFRWRIFELAKKSSRYSHSNLLALPELRTTYMDYRRMLNISTCPSWNFTKYKTHRKRLASNLVLKNRHYNYNDLVQTLDFNRPWFSTNFLKFSGFAEFFHQAKYCSADTARGLPHRLFFRLFNFSERPIDEDSKNVSYHESLDWYFSEIFQTKYPLNLKNPRKVLYGSKELPLRLPYVRNTFQGEVFSQYLSRCLQKHSVAILQSAVGQPSNQKNSSGLLNSLPFYLSSSDSNSLNLNALHFKRASTFVGKAYLEAMRRQYNTQKVLSDFFKLLPNIYREVTTVQGWPVNINIRLQNLHRLNKVISEFYPLTWTYSELNTTVRAEFLKAFYLSTLRCYEKLRWLEFDYWFMQQYFYFVNGILNSHAATYVLQVFSNLYTFKQWLWLIVLDKFIIERWFEKTLVYATIIGFHLFKDTLEPWFFMHMYEWHKSIWWVRKRLSNTYFWRNYFKEMYYYWQYLSPQPFEYGWFTENWDYTYYLAKKTWNKGIRKFHFAIFDDYYYEVSAQHRFLFKMYDFVRKIQLRYLKPMVLKYIAIEENFYSRRVRFYFVWNHDFFDKASSLEALRSICNQQDVDVSWCIPEKDLKWSWSYFVIGWERFRRSLHFWWRIGVLPKLKLLPEKVYYTLRGYVRTFIFTPLRFFYIWSLRFYDLVLGFNYGLKLGPKDSLLFTFWQDDFIPDFRYVYRLCSKETIFKIRGIPEIPFIFKIQNAYWFYIESPARDFCFRVFSLVRFITHEAYYSFYWGSHTFKVPENKVLWVRFHDVDGLSTWHLGLHRMGDNWYVTDLAEFSEVFPKISEARIPVVFLDFPIRLLRNKQLLLHCGKVHSFRFDVTKHQVDPHFFLPQRTTPEIRVLHPHYTYQLNYLKWFSFGNVETGQYFPYRFEWKLKNFVWRPSLYLFNQKNEWHEQHKYLSKLATIIEKLADVGDPKFWHYFFVESNLMRDYLIADDPWIRTRFSLFYDFFGTFRDWDLWYYFRFNEYTDRWLSVKPFWEQYLKYLSNRLKGQRKVYKHWKNGTFKHFNRTDDLVNPLRKKVYAAQKQVLADATPTQVYRLNVLQQLWRLATPAQRFAVIKSFEDRLQTPFFQGATSSFLLNEGGFLPIIKQKGTPPLVSLTLKEQLILNHLSLFWNIPEALLKKILAKTAYRISQYDFLFWYLYYWSVLERGFSSALFEKFIFNSCGRALGLSKERVPSVSFSANYLVPTYKVFPIKSWKSYLVLLKELNSEWILGKSLNKTSGIGVAAVFYNSKAVVKNLLSDVGIFWSKSRQNVLHLSQPFRRSKDTIFRYSLREVPLSKTSAETYFIWGRRSLPSDWNLWGETWNYFETVEETMHLYSPYKAKRFLKRNKSWRTPVVERGLYVDVVRNAHLFEWNSIH